jgi:glycosyltransferase involved in cell wall biosynthesis
LATSLGLWSAIRREVRDRDLVDIHQLYFFSTWVAAREARRAGVPYFVHPHGTLEPYQRRRSRLVKLLWDAAVGRAVLRHASGFICTTASEADGAAAVIGRDRTHVVALGATIGASEAEPPVMDIPYVLFLGRIAPKKRLDVLIESFAAVAPCWPGALVIAGTGDAALVARLKDLARRLLPSDRVRFLGHVEGTRKAWLLTHARAFVLPSENENFAISVAESLVAGTPVILTSHVATAGLVEHFGAGRVVDLDPNAVATALAELLTDDETHADLARGARAAAAELSWARTAAGVEQAYLDTLAGSRPALTS